MATGTVPPELPSAGLPPNGRSEMVEYDHYITSQIQRTRRQVKGVELASTLLILAIGLLGYGFLVAVIDSWVITGGLGVWGRLAAFAILVIGTVGYLALRVVPLLRLRVNPIYAAHTIEQGQPSLKNSLINFLLLQGDRSRLPVPVYEAIERRAAQDLSTVPADSTVDRSPVIRSGYVLLALVTIFCLYSLMSPKSPLKSLRRMLFPWSSVAAPTRVTIGDVQPGPARAFVGESLTVSALVRGIRKDEPVTLYFTTEGGQSVDQPLTMQPPSDGYRHEVVLPPTGGLQQTLDYRIAAGDAQAGPFHVQVLATPAILIEQVRYEFPAYTRLTPRVVERQGDLKGIEGTQVTLQAKTNVDITSAYVDFNCDGTRDLELVCDGRAVTGTFELKLDPNRKPLYTTYQLRFTDAAKQLNPQPIRYEIDVLPDQTPEIEITQPGADNYELPLNSALTIGVQAKDRDFGLRRVTLFFERNGKRLHTVELLDTPQSDPFTGAHVFEPGKLTATPVEVGDVLQYWAEARDSRAPTANHVQTVKYRLKIVAKVDDAVREQQLADAQKKAEEAAAANKPPEDEARPPQESAEEKSGDEPPADEGAATAVDENTKGEDRAASEDATRPDPEADTEAAMEKILQHQQQKDQSQSDQANEEKKSPEEKSEEEQLPEQGSGDGESGSEGSKSGQKEGSQGKAGSKSSQKSDESGEESSQGGEESGQGKDSSNNQSGKSGKSGSNKNAGKSQPNQSPAGESESESDSPKNTDGKQPPDGKQSGKQPGKNKPGGKPQNDKSQAGKQPANDKQPGADQSPEGSSEEGASGDNAQDPKQGAGTKQPKQPGGKQGQPPENQKQDPGKQPGEQPAGGEQAGDDQTGEGKAGQQPQGDKPQAGKQPGKNSGAEKQPGQEPGGDQAGEKPQAGNEPKEGGDSQQGEGAPKDSSNAKPGDGDATAGSGTPEQKEPMGGEGKQPAEEDQPKPTGGDPENSKGEGGGGKPDSKPSPTPAAQEANQPRNQGSPPPEQKPGEKKSEEASSPSNSPKQSKQHSDEQGDRSADGSKGGGQKSESPGTGSPGQNTESDEGSGEANQPGAGEKKAGQGDLESEKPTGEAGGQSKGEGSSSKPSQGGQKPSQQQSGSKESGQKPSENGKQPGAGQQQPGGDASSSSGGSQGESPSDTPGNTGNGATPPPDDPGNSRGAVAQTTDEMNANDPTGKSTGGGKAGAEANADQKPFEPAETQAEAPNKEYAQRATDLALESLQEQMAKRQVDPELLEKLNWSQDDMKKFVDRWQQLKRDAAKQGPEGDAARKQLDNTMERLGAARRGLTIQSREKGPDNVQRLREGRGSKPPAEYREQFEAYTEGAAHRGK